jgi:AcrR family transcriptional regulator
VSTSRNTSARSAKPARPRGRRGSTALASERRDHLVKLAAELFAEKGFQATTVREIADEAGILSGSLYHHFDSKESIVDEVLSGYLDELLTSYRATMERGGTPRELLSELVVTAFGTLETHRAAITVMQNDWNYLRQLDRFGYLVKAEHEVEAMWVGLLKDGAKKKVFRSDVDPKLTYRLIRDTIWVAVRWYRPGGPLTTKQIADQYLTILFDGLCR